MAQQGNPYYVEPMGGANISQGIMTGLAFNEQRNRRDQQRQQQERTDAGRAAMSTASTDAERTQVMKDFPELAAEMRAQATWTSDQSKARHSEDYSGIYNAKTTQDAEKILQQRILWGQQNGVDMTETLEDLTALQAGETDLEGLKSSAELELMGTEAGLERLAKFQALKPPPYQAASTVGKMVADLERVRAANPNDPMIKHMEAAIQEESGLGMNAMNQIDPALLENLDAEVGSKAKAAYSAAGGGKDGMKAYEDVLKSARENSARTAVPQNLEALYPNAEPWEMEAMQRVATTAANAETGLKAAEKMRSEQRTNKKALGNAQTASRLITELLENDELGDVIGPREGDPESWVYEHGNSDAEANAIANIERAANLLTVENMDLMTGILSESDIKILRDVGAGGLNRKQGEEQFRKEAQKIVDILNKVQLPGKPQRQAGASGGVQRTTPSGVTYTILPPGS